MTVDAKLGQAPRQDSLSATEDIRKLAALAEGDDFAAFEVGCRTFEAKHPRSHLALLHRCRAKERLFGAAVAAADARENWTKYAPTANFVQFVVNLMRRAGDLPAARSALEAGRVQLGPSRVLDALDWQVAVDMGDLAAVERLLSAGSGGPYDPVIEAWKAAGLALLERPVPAVSHMLGAIRQTEEPAALLPAIRRFTGDSRQLFASALHARLQTDNAPAAPEAVLWFIAHAFWEGGKHAEALAVLPRLFSAGGVLADRARLLAAQCAAALGDQPAAREHLSTVVLKHCPPALATDMMTALGRVVFDWQGRQVITRLLAHLPQIEGKAGSSASSLDIIEGRFDRIIAGFFERDPEARLAPEVLFPFCVTCVETGRWDELRRGLASLPLGAALPAAQLRRLRNILRCIDDPDLTRPVAQALMGRIPPDGQEALMLALETGEGTALEEAGRHALVHLQAGNPAIALRLSLSSAGGALPDRLSPELASALRQQSIDRIDLTDISQRAQMWSQRHLCTFVEAGFPEPRQEAVSIIAPVHRAGDLPNLSANLARQTWTNVETIVVANGDLYRSPLVAEALRGVPNLTILNENGKSIGSYLNLAVRHASGDIVMRFDADDVYFADYVRSSVRALQAMNAEVAGKHSCFVYLEAARRVFLRNPAPFYTDAQRAGYYGVGATHIVRRDVFREIQYLETVARGEDYLFFERCGILGLRNINLDPFNYLIVRKNDKTAHTWQVDDLSAVGTGACYIGGPEVVPLIANPDPPAELITLPGL